MSTAANLFANPSDPAGAAGQPHWLATATEPQPPATERQPSPSPQPQGYEATIQTQADELRQARQTIRRLTDDLSLLTAGLTDTIADSLQATEFARADAEAQRQRLHRLVANAPFMIAVLSGPGQVIELANENFRALFGQRELVGQPLRQAVPALASQPFFAQLGEVYRTGEACTGSEQPIEISRGPAGQVVPLFIDYVLQATRDGRGCIDGLLFFAYDVTEPVRARRVAAASQQQVQALNQHLTRLNEELDSFVYMASHDLHGPLHNLSGLLQLLGQELAPASPPAPVARLLALMQDSLGRFQHTLQCLASNAQLAADAGQLAPSLSLADIVGGVLLDLALPIAEAGAQISVELAAQPAVALPEKHLRSLVYNLLSNAIKYRHPDRALRVRVRTAQLPEAVALEVQDNGLGMSEPQQSQLFSLFKRLHTHVEGSGVGLYLSKRLVESAGGTITAESQLNVGTTFTVTLPTSAR